MPLLPDFLLPLELLLRLFLRPNKYPISPTDATVVTRVLQSDAVLKEQHHVKTFLFPLYHVPVITVSFITRGCRERSVAEAAQNALLFLPSRG